MAAVEGGEEGEASSANSFKAAVDRCTAAEAITTMAAVEGSLNNPCVVYDEGTSSEESEQSPLGLVRSVVSTCDFRSCLPKIAASDDLLCREADSFADGSRFVSALIPLSQKAKQLITGLAASDSSLCRCSNGVCNKSCLNVIDRRRCTSELCSFGGLKYCGNNDSTLSLTHHRREDTVVRLCSAEKGYGVFLSTTPAHKDDFLMAYVGYVINPNSSTGRKAYLQSKYAVRGGRKDDPERPQFIIDAKRAGNSSRFINGSCKPNARLEDWRVAAGQYVFVLANKFILPNVEELTVDYNWTLEKFGGYCHCGHLYFCKHNPRIVTMADRGVKFSPLQSEIIRIFRNDFEGVQSLREGLLTKASKLLEMPQISQIVGNEWLGSHVLNEYFNLLQQRDKEHSRLTGTRSSLFISTYFMESMCDTGDEDKYNFVAGLKFLVASSQGRWFEKKRIFIPTNLKKPKPLRVGILTMDGYHWVLIDILMKETTIHYYDTNVGVSSKSSFSFRSATVITQKILSFLEDLYEQELRDGFFAEADKIPSRPSKATWTIQIHTKATCPQQRNGVDCGVGVAMIAERLAVDHSIMDIDTSDPMENSRNKILVSLFTQEIVY
jgi:hypothetical protein